MSTSSGIISIIARAHSNKLTSSSLWFCGPRPYRGLAASRLVRSAPRRIISNTGWRQPRAPLPRASRWHISVGKISNRNRSSFALAPASYLPMIYHIGLQGWAGRSRGPSTAGTCLSRRCGVQGGRRGESFFSWPARPDSPRLVLATRPGLSPWGERGGGGQHVVGTFTLLMEAPRIRSLVATMVKGGPSNVLSSPSSTGLGDAYC